MLKPLLDRDRREVGRGWRWAIGAVASTLLVLLALIDVLTGPELSFSIFYLPPVFIAAWYLGRAASILIAIAAAVLWLCADWAAGNIYSHPGILVWNAAVRLGIFLLIAWLLWEVQTRMGQLRDQATRDGLTGLSNRRAFYERLDNELRRAERYHAPLTLVYIDLDGFKAINDSYGHEEGDRLLQVVAEALCDTSRQTDVAARLGGDEFALLLPETDYEGADAELSRVRRQLDLAMAQRGWAVTFSVGAVTCLAPQRGGDDVVKRADQLMYSVKREGKNAIRHERWDGCPVVPPPGQSSDPARRA